MKRGLRILMGVLALTLLAGFATHTNAQVLLEDDPYLYPRTQLTLHAGGFDPLGDLGLSEFDRSVTFGGTFGLWVTENVGVRANLLGAETDLPTPPSDLSDIESPRVWLYNADLLLRKPFETDTGRLMPYVLGGLGWKTYDFDNVGNETDFTGNYGAGLEYRFAGQPWGILVEVRDFVSTFDLNGIEDTQHDVVWTGGLSFTF